MVLLRSQNKITDFLMILAWASPFNVSVRLNFTSTSINPIVALVLLSCAPTIPSNIMKLKNKGSG